MAVDAPWRIRTQLIQGPPGPGKYLNAVLQHTPSYTGQITTFTVSVAGAAIGSPAVVTCDQALGDTFAQAQVTATGVVTVLLFTVSGSPPVLTNANWTVYVLVQG